MPADQKIDGAPSVLYDAVVLLASKQAAPRSLASPAARDFVTDAYAHCKFIGYTGDAAPLFEAAGLGTPDRRRLHQPGRALRRELHHPLR